MCESNATPFTGKATDELTVWKVFRKVYDGGLRSPYYWHGHTGAYALGVWHQAKPPLDDSEDTPMFHAFATREGAEGFMQGHQHFFNEGEGVIRKVKFRRILFVGDVVTAQEMRIPRLRNGIASTTGSLRSFRNQVIAELTAATEATMKATQKILSE